MATDETKTPSRRSRRKQGDREVQIAGRGFVADKGGVHGTQSDTERAGRDAYAASSVIRRGTADSLRAKAIESDEHECACGCGQQPSQADSLFMPGHDSKVRAMGKAVKEGRLKATQLPKIAREYLEAGGML